MKNKALFLIFLLAALAAGLASPAGEAAAASGNPAALRVAYGFDREFAPFTYEDPGGKPVGFEMEIMEAIFRNRAVLAFRPLSRYSVPLELSSGVITVTSGMIKTPQRARTFGLSERPTFILQVRFFTKVYKRVPNAEFLRGQAVAVEEGSFQQTLLEQFGGVNVKPFKTSALALRALYNDEVDAYCGLDEPTYYLIRKLNYGAITTVGAPLGLAEMHIAVNRDRGDVLRIVNDGLHELVAGGEYDRLYRRWFVTELDERERQTLLAEAKKALIGAYAPYGKINYGAAILSATGRVMTGGNVENRDGRLNISAVQSAIARSVSENELELRAVLLLNQEGRAVAPSREDLHSLLEFGRGILVLLPDAQGRLVSKMLPELLPNPITGAVEPF